MKGREATQWKWKMVKATSSDAGAQVVELIDKLCDCGALVVKEEFALVAARLNAVFVACECLEDAEALAGLVYAHNSDIVRVLHDAIIEECPIHQHYSIYHRNSSAYLCFYLQGDGCTHILVELLTHLSFNTTAKAEMLHVGIVGTLVSVFPVLRGIAQRDVLQLLDHVTTEDAPLTRQYRPGHQLCRMPCVRLVFSVLRACAGADHKHPPAQCLTPTMSLLDKITDAIVTAQATQAAGQLTSTSWERSPAGRASALLEQLAPRLLSLLAAVATPCGDEAAAVASGRASKHVAASGGAAHLGRMVARIQFRVQRWCPETRQSSKPPKTQDVQKCVTTTEPVEMNTGRN